MKKVLSVFLCLAVLISSLAICIAAADDTLRFAVASDLHYSKTPSIAGVHFPDDKYYCADEGNTLKTESKAIIKQFLREVAASDVQYVLLCGDLVDAGTVEQHRDMAKLLADFERDTGKSVFVTDGNHDFNAGISVPLFKELYAGFGYDEALTVDDDTCSYTVDLDNRYRLLSIDSCNHVDGADGFTAELLAWVTQQAVQAKEDGKKLVVMQHHSFLEHIPMQATLMTNYITRPGLDLKTQFLNWDVRYVFSGHMHGHDITAYTDGVGRKVYDILTASLTGYPCAYRMCSLTGEGMDVKTVRIQGVDAADLPQSGYTDELLSELTGDFETFALGCFKVSFTVRKNAFFSESALRRILSKLGGGDSVQGIIDAFYPEFYRMLTLPIYTEDAGNGESLQAYGEELGLDFPKTDKKTIFDSICYFISVLYGGDENIPYDDPEIILAVQCGYTALYTAVKTLRADLREQLFGNLRANFSGMAKPFAVVTALKAALGAAKDEKALETVILLAAPFVEMFSVDDETPDNDAFLADADGARTTFFTKFVDFFRMLFAYIQRFTKGIVQIYIPIRRTSAA